MIVLSIEPLSIVQPVANSALSSIITFPIWGNFIFLFFIGINPNPFWPILQLSCITTRSPIIVFFIITLDPITQSFPIIELLSIIEFEPTNEFLPILIFLPTKTLLPNFTVLNLAFFGFLSDISG